ncbi:MAG: hypothetical protein ACI4PF_04145 [Christensenellales bacterium]
MSNKVKVIILNFFCILLSSIFLFGFTMPTNELLIKYEGEIEHLAFNTLMAFPDKALDPKNNLSSSYDESKITPIEFENILNELHKNDYILIDIEMLYTIENNVIRKEDLYLPKNKKPIILSFDNVTYKSSYQNLGNIDKIIVDRNNNLASYTTKKSIQDRIQYDNEFMLILENFINAHKDFSYNNSRGIIFLTGENGILGYNTCAKNSSSKNESKRVSEVIHKLKNLGWKFGSNNYSYKDENTLSDIEFAKELSLWDKEIKGLVGTTPLYAYPYGISSNNDNKNKLLIDNGFQVFFITNNEKPNITLKDNTIIMSRREINGNTLRNNTENLSNLFDCEKVYDHTNRTINFINLTQ